MRQALLALLLLAGASPAQWHTDYAKANREALADKKTVCAYFCSDACPACRKFEKETLADGRVKDALTKLVCVQVKGRADLEKFFQLSEYPSVVFIRPDGSWFAVRGKCGPVALLDAIEGPAQRMPTKRPDCR